MAIRRELAFSSIPGSARLITRRTTEVDSRGVRMPSDPVSGFLQSMDQNSCKKWQFVIIRVPRCLTLAGR